MQPINFSLKVSATVGFRGGGVLVLIAPVPGHCSYFTFFKFG